MTPSLYLVYLLFIKNRMILEQDNFVSAQISQRDLYFQCSFCDRLQLKESIFFLFLKTGSYTPDVSINVTKTKVSVPGLDNQKDNALLPFQAEGMAAWP